MTVLAQPGWRATCQKLHLPFLWLTLLFMTLNCAEVYRSLLYLNLFGLLAYGLLAHAPMPRRPSREALILLAIPISLTLLHWLAVGHVEIIKEIRQLWLGVFLAISIWACGSALRHGQRQPLEKAFVILLGLYAVAQVVALAVMGRPYGTNKNPHYLAFYSSLALMLAAYLFCRTRGWWRAALLLMSPVLGYLILISSSRPAWIALVLAILVFLVLVNVRSKRWILMMLVVVPALLFVSDIGHFGSRLTELVQDIDHEERVVIWHNAWQMQQASQPAEWLWGHGLDSYREAFKQYSQYHGIVDFNSPHNSAFELLYISGIAGLLCYLVFYLLLYYRLWKFARRPETSAAAGLMISVATFNALFISITIPVFTSYNLYVLAIVVGGLFWLRAIREQGR